MLCVYRGSVALVNKLLESGVHINAQTQSGDTGALLLRLFSFLLLPGLFSSRCFVCFFSSSVRDVLT